MSQSISAVQVRKATPGDAAELLRLNTLFNGAGEMTPEQLVAQQAVCTGVESAYLAEVGGRIVGFACLRLIPTIFSSAPYAELTELFVEVAYQRHGIGRALIDFVEAEAQAAGAEELFLMTGFRNTVAHHFYHRSGYSLRCFTMHKPLTTAAQPAS